MLKEIFQIVYAPSKENPNDFHRLFKEEAMAMQNIGILVDVKPLPIANKLMYRGTTIKNEYDYPNDSRYINSFKENINYLHLSLYHPFIENLSIDTFFSDELDDAVIEEIEKRGWGKAFVKKDIFALEYIAEGKSIWPTTSLKEMVKIYSEIKTNGKYAIRKFIDKNIIDQEDRYWVLNGNIYHRHNKIPNVVKEAAKRLNKLNSRYYTIDATDEFVVEVNPGESSDRHGENSANLFASWIKKEFKD